MKKQTCKKTRSKIDSEINESSAKNSFEMFCSIDLIINARKICASELKIWRCKQKIFSENAAQDWISACRNKLDWNFKQEDKTWWETEQMKDFSRKAWHKMR